MKTALTILAFFVTAYLAPAMAARNYDRVPVKTLAQKPDRALRAAIATLRAAVAKKDRQAVYALLGNRFAIERDFGGLTDRKLSARGQFDAALPGWDVLTRLAAANSWGPWEKGSKLMCGPAALTEADQTRVVRAAKQRGDSDEDYWFEWVYVDLDKVVVRDAPTFKGAVLTTISREAVRALERKDGWFKIALPDGREAYLSERVGLSMFNDRICFSRVRGKWRLAAYIGGGD
jgi:hypothetical protein